MTTGDGAPARAERDAEADLVLVERQVARTADLVLKADALLARRPAAGSAGGHDDRTARLRWAVDRGQRALAGSLPADVPAPGAPEQRRAAPAPQRDEPRSQDRGSSQRG